MSRRIRWALQYAWLTTKHKWFVLVAGIMVDAPLWRLVIHDLSKYGPWELFAYGRQFFGDREDPLGFSVAWLHHQNVNPHHWEYWIPRTGHNRGGYQDGQPLPMPQVFVREMVADWLAASRTYEQRWPTADSWPWFEKNFPWLELHEQTRRDVVSVLAEVLGDQFVYQQQFNGTAISK